MQLHIAKLYKSLVPPFSIELPDFTILTGLNGSGKTHLLNGILTETVQLFDDGPLLNSQSNQTVKYVQSSSLIPTDNYNNSIITRDVVNQAPFQLWNLYTQVVQSLNNPPYGSLEQRLRDQRQLGIIQRIAKDANKAITALTSDDFYNYYPINDNISFDVFSHSLGLIFKRYFQRYDDNTYNHFLRKEKKDSKVPILTEEQFLEKYGEPPWNFVNRVIKEARLDYTVNSPMEATNRDTPFQLKFTNTLNSAEIPLSELSSGEKVLMSLVFAFYNSKYDLVFPKVLLMDEPDASLHPSMSKQFLGILERVFVKEKGVKVIITTHSPSTVAISDESALYLMNKTGQRIEKTTKDRALKILTSGVPSLSINYENRRQVFVESKYDVLFYEKAYDKLKDKLINEISLNFISSGVEGSGSCDQVKNIVTTLSGYGNKFIFGIVDWDKKNNENGHVKVLGAKRRYSLENYLFDPILISALLLREKDIKREELQLSKTENYTDFRNLTAERLQIISDFLVSKVASQISSEDNIKETIKYMNGIEIQIPQWYLHYQGHELEKHLKNTFHSLKRYAKEGDLKKEMINKIIDDIPELLPHDIFELFDSIQNYS